MHCPSCHHEVHDEELETLLGVVPQQIFVLGADLHVEYANKAVIDYHGEALATLVDLLACVARIRLVASEPVRPPPRSAAIAS
jgi:hypothetical protein